MNLLLRPWPLPPETSGRRMPRPIRIFEDEDEEIIPLLVAIWDPPRRT